jgi:hypothetical protein
MVACANEYSYMSNEIGIDAWSTTNWEDLSQETHVISSVSFGDDRSKQVDRRSTITRHEEREFRSECREETSGNRKAKIRWIHERKHFCT